MAFFSRDLLNKKTSIGALWWVGNGRISERQLRSVSLHANVEGLAAALLAPADPLALRTQAVLLRGLVIVCDEQCRLLLDDALKELLRFRAAYSHAPFDMARPTVRFASLTHALQQTARGDGAAEPLAAYALPAGLLAAGGADGGPGAQDGAWSYFGVGLGGEADQDYSSELLAAMSLRDPYFELDLTAAAPPPATPAGRGELALAAGGGGSSSSEEEEAGPGGDARGSRRTRARGAGAAPGLTAPAGPQQLRLLLSPAGTTPAGGSARAPGDVACDGGFGAVQRGDYQRHIGMFAERDAADAGSEQARLLAAGGDGEAEAPAGIGGDDGGGSHEADFPLGEAGGQGGGASDSSGGEDGGACAGYDDAAGGGVLGEPAAVGPLATAVVLRAGPSAARRAALSGDSGPAFGGGGDGGDYDEADADADGAAAAVVAQQQQQLAQAAARPQRARRAARAHLLLDDSAVLPRALHKAWLRSAAETVRAPRGQQKSADGGGQFAALEGSRSRAQGAATSHSRSATTGGGSCALRRSSHAERLAADGLGGSGLFSEGALRSWRARLAAPCVPAGADNAELRALWRALAGPLAVPAVPLQGGGAPPLPPSLAPVAGLPSPPADAEQMDVEDAQGPFDAPLTDLSSPEALRRAAAAARSRSRSHSTDAGGVGRALVAMDDAAEAAAAGGLREELGDDNGGGLDTGGFDDDDEQGAALPGAGDGGELGAGVALWAGDDDFMGGAVGVGGDEGDERSDEAAAAVGAGEVAPLSRAAWRLLRLLRGLHAQLAPAAPSGAGAPPSHSMAFGAHILPALGAPRGEASLRRQAARAAGCVLLLASHARVTLAQAEPYGEVEVAPGPAWATEMDDDADDEDEQMRDASESTGGSGAASVQ